MISFKDRVENTEAGNRAIKLQNCDLVSGLFGENYFVVKGGAIASAFDSGDKPYTRPSDLAVPDDVDGWSGGNALSLVKLWSASENVMDRALRAWVEIYARLGYEVWYGDFKEGAVFNPTKIIGDLSEVTGGASDEH